ncbi:MAG: DUF4214 domain-containing protein [Clostridiales bacterium]|nr:DUF4214 domain-containing protein [Clostridiales bacterium]
MNYSVRLKKTIAALLAAAVIALALPFTAADSNAASVASAAQMNNLYNYYDAATAFLTLYEGAIPDDVYICLEDSRSQAYPYLDTGSEVECGIAIANLRYALSVAQASLLNNPGLANGAPVPVVGTFEGVSAGLFPVSYDSAVKVAATYSTSRNLPISMVRTRIVGEFVDRLYVSILGRASETAGRDYWVDKIESGELTTDDVVLTILNSQEFNSRDMNNTQYVTALYQAFFDRQPDAQGLNNWVNALNNGASRQDIARAFASTPEWTGVCNFYGLDG